MPKMKPKKTDIPKKKKRMERKVTVAKGVKVSRAKEKKMEKKPGSSNVGKYKNVAPKDFAGRAGNTSPYSFPINSLSRARSALKLAHNAPNPEGIRTAVYKRYPELKPKNKKSK